MDYDYDELGRLTQALAQQSRVQGTLGSDNEIDFWEAELLAEEAKSGRFSHDDNGRLTSQTQGTGTPTPYNYYPASFRLEALGSNLPQNPSRNLTVPGTFQYNENGEMIEDRSKRLTVKYNALGYPSFFRIRTGSSPNFVDFFAYNLYDAEMNRVSRLTVEEDQAQARSFLVSSKSDLVIGGTKFKEWQEEYHLGTYGAILDSSEVVMLQGNGGVIGREVLGTRYFDINNYQGSLVLVLKRGATDRELVAVDAREYSPYGRERSLLTSLSPRPSEGYTGKEFEELAALTAYGARWWDPELAVWLTPDKYNEYFDPYGTSRNPVSIVDPDGNCELICAIIITAAVIGAAYGGYQGHKIADAKGYDFTDWETYAYIGGGATIGAAAGAGGAAAGIYGGAYVAGAVGPWAGPLAGYFIGTAVGSAINSLGMKVATGGDSPFLISVGPYTTNLEGKDPGFASFTNCWDQVDCYLQNLSSGLAYTGLAVAGIGTFRPSMNPYAPGNVFDPAKILPGSKPPAPQLQIPLMDPRAPTILQEDANFPSHRPEIAMPDKGGSNSIRQYTMSGGNAEALRQFNSLPLSNVKSTVGGGLYGQMPNGAYVTYYPASSNVSGGVPTLIIRGAGRNIKIRFP